MSMLYADISKLKLTEPMVLARAEGSKMCIPDGFNGIKKHIKYIWTPYTVEDAMALDPYVKRLVLQPGQEEDLWLELPQTHCYLPDGSAAWRRVHSASVVIQFTKALLPMAEALGMSAGRYLTKANTYRFERWASENGQEYEDFGENVRVTGDAIYRQLLAEWAEVAIEPRRAKNYKAANERAATLAEEQRKAKHAREVKARREDTLRYSVRNVSTVVCELVTALATEHEQRKAIYGLDVKANFKVEDTEKVAQAVFGLSVSELVRKKAMPCAARACRRGSGMEGREILRRLLALGSAMKEVKAAKPTYKELRTLSDAGDYRRYRQWEELGNVFLSRLPQVRKKLAA